MIRRKLLLPFLMLSVSSILLFGAEPAPSPIPNDQVSVIFDMNGVLVETSGELYVLGIQKFILYALTQNPLTLKKRIKEKLFELLSAIENRQPGEAVARDERGDMLPQCMCTWMKGTQTPEQLKDAVNEELARRPQNLENSILRDITHMMFTPDRFAKTQHIVPAAVELVRELKEQGYKLYILSNLCSKSFDLIKAKNPEFFELFDGIVISADVGLIKPDPNIYNHLLTTHAIDPHNACFIDDVAVNVQAAQDVGIHSIQCPLKYGYFSGGSPDIETVKNEFQTWRDSLSVSDAAENVAIQIQPA